jgi:predicted alpha/beta-hydrolase family hydrolase
VRWGRERATADGGDERGGDRVGAHARIDGQLSADGWVRPQSLDAAWRALWPQIATDATPVIAGGRSAGSQVACRTAKALGADAVIALSYPLLGPGSPRELLSTGPPLLVVQGGRDPYGTPDQFPPLPPTTTLVAVPFANHTFGVSARMGNTTAGALATVTEAVTTWLDGLLATSL